MRLTAVRWGILVLLMAVSVLLGWRANITFEPQPYRYIPVYFAHPLGWTTNSWTMDR